MSDISPIHADQIDQLVQDLNCNDRWKREAAAKRLGALGVKNEKIITALNQVMLYDDNPYPRRAAREALLKLGETPPPAKTRDWSGKIYLNSHDKFRDLVLGYVGWFVVYGVIWLVWRGFFGFSDFLMKPENGPGAGQVVGMLSVLCLPIYALPILFLWIIRRWAGIGAVLALATNILLAMVFNLIANLFLCIPVFLPIQ